MRILVGVGISLSAIAALVLLPSCGDGGGGTGPDPVPAETLASFALTVPDSITEGEPFSLTVRAVGNRGTNPLTSFSGSVALATTLGTVTPASLTVSAGTGSAQVTLSVPGQQTLSASGGGRSGSALVDVTDLPDPPIEGDPNATVEQAVPDSAFRPRAEDYSDNHPSLPGIYLSHNTLLLAFQLGTTVGQANALLGPLGAELAGAVQGVAGAAPSILFLRLPTTSHGDLEQALTTLRADARVRLAVQDVLLRTDAVSDDDNTHADWTWENTPSGGNWGLELIRAPQMWNLNRAVGKFVGQSGPSIATGVFDSGFVDAQDHDDLAYEYFGPVRERDHGTHVAGIIGAGFANGQGIDGINPFADMVVKARFPPAGGGTVFDVNASYGEVYIDGLTDLASSRTDVAVVNMSMGYGWHHDNIDTDNSQEAQDLAALQGGFLLIQNDIIAQYRTPPIIVTSAGNSSNSGFGVQQAKYNSPMNYAALGFSPQARLPNIIVVEAVSKDIGAQGDATRRGSSNVNGHISAPGTDILSTIPGNTYGVKSGTSMAAPHVTGLIGYMLTVDPLLTLAEVWDLLLWNGIPVAGGASPRIDAWGTIMDIDRVAGNDRVLRMMADIDDGTPDGNQRVRYDTLTFPDFDSLDVDGDGGLGDGDVDMSDFRVWRDWYLKIWQGGLAEFDGRTDHPKMDVNDNKKVETSGGEVVYPRGDFNGDGLITPWDSAYVPGAISAEASDLDVFKEVFSDPNYTEDQLDSLVFSVDIRVDASTLFELMGASSAYVSILYGGGPPPPAFYPTIQSRTILPDDPEQVFTLRHAPTGYRIEIDVNHPAYGSDGLAFGTDAVQVGTELGSDVSVRPIVGFEFSPNATYTTTCEDPGAQDAVPIALADWGIVPGDILIIDAEGFFLTGGDPSDQLQAVFSNGADLDVDLIDLPGDSAGAPPKKLVRRTIPGAIEAGSDVYTPPTQECDGQVADIPQDFSITPHAIFQVPDSATHLFVGVLDSHFDDNQQDPIDPLELSFTAIYAPEWDNRIQRVSGSQRARRPR
jgi:hypothetical protein